MAEKQYSVKLDLQVSQAINNIDQILSKVATLKSSVADLDDSEVALNVVVRNHGFQNLIGNLNKALLKAEKDSETAGKKIGSSLNKGIDDSVEKITKNSGFKKATEDISKKVKAEVEKSVKGLDKTLKDMTTTVQKTMTTAFKNVAKTLEKTIADSVTGGMAKGLRGLTAGATKTFNAQTLTFKTNFEELDAGLDKVHEIANQFEKLQQALTDAAKGLSLLSMKDKNALYDQAMGMARDIAKTSAHDLWSQNNMSKKDQAHYEVENRRLDLEQEALGIAKVTQALAAEREQQKLVNDEKRKSADFDKEQERKDKKLKAQLGVYDKQGKLVDLQTQREQNKLEAERRKTLDQIAQKKAQEAQLEKYAAENANRTRIQNTEIEQALFNYRKASLRVLQQEKSTARGLHVDESAIAQAAKDKKDAEIIANQAILKQVAGYEKIKKSSESTVKSLQKAATAMQRWSSAVSSIGGVLSTFRQLANSMASAISKAGSTFFGYARQAASSIASAATEQYRQLELAQIGFTNFYGSDKANDLIKQIKELSMKAPGVDAGDLADYVRQLAPVSGGDSQKALDAAMGMLKTINYGGGEASQEMEYVIKNIRDVISKGTATAIDLRQFNRAMPIMEEVLESIGRSDFIKNGQLKIDKNNAKELLSAFADINNDPKSPVANIFDQMANTLSGITDVIKQTFITRLNDTLIDLGFYDKIKQILKDFYDSGYIEKFYQFIGNTAVKILDWLSSLDWEGISNAVSEGAKAIWQSIQEVARMIMETMGETNLAGVIQKIMGIVANFVRGFGEGANKVLEVIKWAEENLGPDILNKAASLLGLLASPLGSLLQGVLGIVQNVLNFGSRITYYAAQKVGTKAENQLAKIQSWVENPDSVMQHANSVAAFKENGVLKEALINQSIDPTRVRTGGSLKNNNLWLWDKAADTYSSLQKDGSWYTSGGLSNMTRTQRIATIGDGSLLKGALRVGEDYVKKAGEKITQFAGKAVKAFAIYEVGHALSSAAESIVVSATGSADAGRMVKGLGDAASTAIALGTQFGPLGAAFGLLAETVKQTATVIGQMKEESKEYAEQMRDSMYGQSATNIMETLVNSFREQGKYEAGNEIDADAQAKMYDQIIADLKAKKSVDEIMKNAQDTYFNTRATSMAREDLTERTKNVDLGETLTPITDKTSTVGLQQAYRKLESMGLLTTDLLTWATRTMGREALVSKGIETDNNDPENVAKLLTSMSATEIMNYLKQNGLSLSSEEAINSFLGLADTTLTEFLENKDYNADLTFSIASNGETYNSWEELLTAAGFTRDDQYGWVLKATLQLTQSADEQADKKMWDLVQDAKKGAKWYEMPGLSLLSLAAVPGKLFGWYGQGGAVKQVKPIYRANGSDSPERGVDTVPTMLQPGEFVMRKSAVSNLGMGVLNALNFGDLGKAAQLLGSKFNGSWNNSRSYSHNVNTVNKYVTNKVSVFNRSNSGRVNSYNALANRLATGF